jgi:prepilin-type N-terminal cleavage/methylation domain-containing protein
MTGKGFSLPEILVVMALVGVLAVLLLANFLSAKHKHALACAEAQGLFSFIPSRSRFCRRLQGASLKIRMPE